MPNPVNASAASRAHILFARYDESHRHPRNKAIHAVCVPAITWSVLAALWAWTPAAAMALVLAAMVFYVRMSVPIAVGMLGAVVLLLAPLPLLTQHLAAVAATVFVLAWIGQFIGHRIEGRKPSFFEDAGFLLVGPAWLLAAVYRRLGIAY